MVGKSSGTGELPKGQGPFSRIFVADDIQRDRSITLDLVATAAECEAVADELGLEAVRSLRGKLTVFRQARGVLQVEGEVRADIDQICVVTLEPFGSEIVEPVSIKFAPEVAPGTPPRKVDVAEAVEVSMDEDPPDPIINGRVDLGAVVVEFLALGLDPYPRKPGVEFTPDPVLDDEPTAESPFAALASLKRPDGR
jgi:hypothetical protein